MTGHDKPYLSVIHPHLCFSPPSESFSHNSSTSCCVSQFTKSEMAGVNVKCGPPLKAMNSCPSNCPARSINADNPGIFKNGNIKVHRFLGVVVEPQEWGDLLHGIFPFVSAEIPGSANASGLRCHLQPTRKAVERTVRATLMVVAHGELTLNCVAQCPPSTILRRFQARTKGMRSPSTARAKVAAHGWQASGRGVGGVMNALPPTTRKTMKAQAVGYWICTVAIALSFFVGRGRRPVAPIV